MSSRIFQSVIVQMKDATKRAIGVAAPDGTIIASSDLSLMGGTVHLASVPHDDGGDRIFINGGKTYRPLGVSTSENCYVFVDGEDDMARTLCIMASVAINEAGVYFEENNDKRAFIRNIITENILPGDILVRSKELRFPPDVTRGVIVLRHGSAFDSTEVELLQETFPDIHHGFVVATSETDIALIMDIPPAAEPDFLIRLAETIGRKLLEELSVNVVIGIGTPARHIRELSDRYKEALISIDIGKVFDASKTVINYENLGIGRLIYQLPTTLCEMFLSEVFKRNPVEALDQETLFTIDKFFENNLNVSETSRKLFVHRNTLVYRLEKIKKITALDLREFDHAIIFKVALMVKKYLVSQESKY